MRRIKLAWIPAVLLFAGMALGQVSSENIFPFKDMVFPQVAAGGGFESWLTVTNRGPEAWNGNLEFYRGTGDPWNPVVDGTPIVGGSLLILVNPKATKTYKVTLPGSTEAGYAMFVADDLNLTNFLEGNLTYYLSSGDLITDSVGVPPAQQFLVSSLPFEDFNSICIGLVNTDPEKRDATLKLKVFSEANVQMGQTKEFPLVALEYSAQYLNELFPGITLGRGRLEIASDIPVSGMAITQAPGNQFSSLPLNSTIRTYSLEPTNDQYDLFNHLTLWTESFFVKGYLEIWISEEWTLFAVSGQIDDGELHLHFEDYGSDSEVHEWFFGFIRSNEAFTLGQQSFMGTWYATHPRLEVVETGTFTATLIP
jgi:hypothetical protein